MSDNGRLNDYIAGAVGGCAGLVVGHPFDTTKVQLQTQAAANRYSGTVDAMKNVYKQGWTKGFFRGMSWPVFSYGVVNSVFFGVYGHALSVLRRLSDRPDDKPRFWEIYTAGCVGGAAAVVVCCPVDLVKVVLQSQIPHGDKAFHPSHTSRGPMEAAMHIVREKGMRGLYRGVSIHLPRDVPAAGTYFLTFEWMNAAQQIYLPSIPVSLFHFLSGGIAGVLSWLVILPLDVVKSRYQAEGAEHRYRSILHCASTSYKEEGISVFFRGCAAMSIRAFPVNAVTLGVYGWCMTYLNGSSSLFT